jgi:hypothetical protein
MPFTAAQVVLFFEDQVQVYMALTCRTATALAAGGIAIPDNLSEYDKEGMNSIYQNWHKPAKVTWDGMAGTRGELCEIQAYKVSAKSQICLTIGAVAAKFYDDIGCALDPDNMLWMVLKRFDEQHKALMVRMVGDLTYVPPKLTKNFSTYKWLESFVLCLCQKVGVCNCPLEYVVRDVTMVAAICPPLKSNEPHSTEHGESIEGDMIACMSHAHPLFKVDNGAVFELIKNAVRGTAVAASIVPFCREQMAVGHLWLSGLNMLVRMFGINFTRKPSLPYRL